MKEASDKYGLEPQNPWINRIQAAFEIFLIAGIVSSFIAAFPFYRKLSSSGFQLQNVSVVCGYVLLEATLTIIFLSMVMSAHREGPKKIGLRWEAWKSNAWLGLGLVPVLFLCNGLIGYVFQTYFPQHFSSRNPLLEIIHTRGELAFFVVSAIFAGGIKEELQRAFILTRFGEWFGGAWLGLLLWSIAFGAAHYVQGLQGIVTAGLFGFLFGIVYLLRGSLIGPMVAHGLYDTLALLGYWFFRNSLQ
jgi:membrane protease YdiL (CAAX protease family)